MPVSNGVGHWANPAGAGPGQPPLTDKPRLLSLGKG